MNQTWLKPRTDGQPGNGTQADPFNGSTPDMLDSRLDRMPPHAVVNFLPGEYRSRGRNNITGGWQPKRGQKLIGEGAESVLKLVEAQEEGSPHVLIGSEYNAQCDGLEISNLTLDCLIDAQPGVVAAGGIAVYGSHVKIERVQVENWGSRTDRFEGFAVAANGGHPDYGSACGNLIIQCRAVKATRNMSAAGATAFAVFGADELRWAHRAPVIRECFVSGRGSRLVRAFTITGSIDGLVEESSAEQCQFGYYADSSFNHGITIRKNWFHDCEIGVGWNYGDRQPGIIEPRVAILENLFGITPAGDSARVGISLTGTKQDGPSTFEHAAIRRNRIYPVASPDGLAGVSIFRAAHVELEYNLIELPVNRILLNTVKSHRVVDQYVEL